MFCKNRLSDDVPGSCAAAMMGLVRKRYIEMERVDEKLGWTEKNIMLRIIAGNVFDQETGQRLLAPLTVSEENYFQLIRRYVINMLGGFITLADFKKSVAHDYDNTDAFLQSMKGVVKTVGESGGYFQQREYKGLKKHAFGGVTALTVIGVLIAIIGNLISYQTRLFFSFGAFFVLGAGFIAAAVLLRQFCKKYVLLTQYGEDEYAKWRGLYNFLNGETLMKERTVPEIAIWEEYLIYATAFGISDKVVKALKLAFPDMNTSQSAVFRHPYLYSRAFVSTYNRSFRSVARTASFTSRTGSHGGGYGGGGRGGGGGH